ncbi:MAG: hypothetical protein IPM26_05740 [Saprospiraceae bacterium]|nr:hypothetical protein [Saprospiraceae bacterium]
MKKSLKILSGMLFLILFGQMYNHAQTYGHEWIPAGGNCVKVKIAVNGYYRLKPSQLRAGGMEGTEIRSEDLKLINFGRELPLDLTKSSGPLIEDDYIGFYAEKNTIGLDSLLYKDWKKDLFNPEYSHVTDTNAYFICLEPGVNHLRYTEIQQDIAGNSDTPWPYYLHDEKVIFTSNYFKNVDGDVRYSNFEPSEGFGSELRQNSTINLTVSGFLPSAIAPVLSIRGGANNHLQKLQLNLNGQFLDTLVSGAKQNINRSYTLNEQDIKSAMNLNIRNLDPNDRHRIAYVSLQYTRAFQFGGGNSYRFTMDASDSSRKIEISGFNLTGGNIVLYDLNKGLRYNTLISGDKVLAVIGPSDGNTDYLLVNENSGILTVPQISRPEIIMPQYNDEDYIIISNKVLRPEASDYVLEYAAYRSSAEGGSHKVKIVDVQEIYDLFGYGIDRHFYSFKNFSEYIRRYWQEVKFVLILGKGIEYPFARKPEEVEAMLHKTFYIPSYGYPASDNMLFSERDFPDPYFAIGRIAARNAEDIKIYLDKIKEYDAARRLPQTIEDRYWMKRVLHLGGGKNNNEQDAIRNGLDNVARVLRESAYGAEVRSFYKLSSDAVQFAVNEEINRMFENGLGLINFFGHSSVGTWDFSIENPRNYDNFGKYPIILSLGCYSGNLHGSVKGISESFVLEKNRGSIAFFASTGTAFIPTLANYSREFYQLFTDEYRNRTMGEVITFLANKYRNSTFSNYAFYSQMTYHGDPAVKMYIFDGPDYVFDNNSVKTDPALIQASQEDFFIETDIVNIGAHTKDSVEIAFYHSLPDGKVIDTLIIKKEGIASKEKLKIPLKNYGLASIGKNILNGIIDPDNKISEVAYPAAENNNTLNFNRGYEFFVTDNFAKTVYPPDLGIINTGDHYVLKASTTSVPVAKAKYIVQIDTTAYFNSPLLESASIESEGGLIEYRPATALVNERVYYWRISPDSAAGQGYKWSGASFVYLPDEEEGWNQSHFFQFLGNDFLNTEFGETTKRRLEFGREFNFVKIRNRLWDVNDKPGYFYNNVRFGSVSPWDFMDAGVGMVVNNQFNMWDLLNPAGGLFGSFNPTGTALDVFAFRTNTPEERKKVVDFIESKITKGYYLTFFTIQRNEQSDYKPQEWDSDMAIYGNSIFNVLEKLGAQRVRELETTGSVPYLIQLVNGDEGVLAEKVAENVNGIIESNVAYYNKRLQGEVQSSAIGPMTRWNSIKYEFLPNNFQNATSSVNIIGIEKSGNEKIIDKELWQNNNLSGIQSNIYPYLKISANLRNPNERIPPQLKYWRIAGKPLPDAAVELATTSNPPLIEVQHGQNVSIRYKIRNTNYIAMDSILVKYTIFDQNNNTNISYKRLQPLQSNGVIEDNFRFPVLIGYEDIIKVVIEINPDKDQEELYFFNNSYVQNFKIIRDNVNPILDIYFDGIKIMDRDIVSPTPEIRIELRDNNILLPLNDPRLFEIQLDTGRNQSITVPFDSPDLRFFPGNETEPAILIYSPKLTDGDYRLTVQGRDISGNKSGLKPQSINFRVITESAVSNILNYPNPFSTSTQFIFTLTGREIPQDFSIIIMTLSGKIVKEIHKNELGNLRIGLNKTEYRWDGTDDYGSKLANGVYLYKVNIRNADNREIKHFEIKKADSFFKEGFGKLVIMR